MKRDLPGITEEPTKKSTGIGLYLCKKIMDRLHHNIYIEVAGRTGEQKCTCIWNVNRDSYRNVRMNREMSSKSMEVAFPPFFIIGDVNRTLRKGTGKQMTLLEVQNVKKIYTTRFGGNQVEALRNVNFSVEQREYVWRSWERVVLERPRF